MLWHKVQGAGGQIGSDPFFDSVSLLLQGSLSDQSSFNQSVSVVGGVNLSSTQTKFSDNSIYFDGSDDVLQVSDDNGFSFGSGDFTLETWIYPTRTGVNQRFFGQYASSTNQWFLRLGTSNNIQIYFADQPLFLSGGTVSTNAWSHVACVREGSDLSLYLDGSRVAQRAITVTLLNYASTFTVGSGATSNSSGIFDELRGYMDGARVTKGIARYTGLTYPIPTRAFAVD